jgi:hypothetical protein
MDFDLNENDYVFLKNNKGQITSGGFVVNSDFLNSKIEGNSNFTQNGGGRNKHLIDSFKDLGVPLGLFYNGEKDKYKYRKYENEKRDIIDNSIYDKLLENVSLEKRKLFSIKTKKNNKNNKNNLKESNKRTRKQKKIIR